MIDQSNKDLLLGLLIDFMEEKKFSYGSSRSQDLLMIIRAVVKGERSPVFSSVVLSNLKKKDWYPFLEPYLCGSLCKHCDSACYAHKDYPFKNPNWAGHEDHDFVPNEDKP